MNLNVSLKNGGLSLRRSSSGRKRDRKSSKGIGPTMWSAICVIEIGDGGFEPSIIRCEGIGRAHRCLRPGLRGLESERTCDVMMSMPCFLRIAWDIWPNAEWRDASVSPYTQCPIDICESATILLADDLAVRRRVESPHLSYCSETTVEGIGRKQLVEATYRSARVHLSPPSCSRSELPFQRGDAISLSMKTMKSEMAETLSVCTILSTRTWPLEELGRLGEQVSESWH